MEKIKNQLAYEPSNVTYLQPSDKCCPVCGSTNIQSIDRVTGYLSMTERFGEGKLLELKQRLDHNGKHVPNHQ